MAVEIAFLSVVLRKEALARSIPELVATVKALFNWEPDWFREDAHLAATSFMCPANVRAFGTALEQRTGLALSADWTVVDMLLGPISPTSWLAFRGGPGAQTGVWLEGTQPGGLSRVPAMLPGKPLRPGQRLQIQNAFGRDTRHDPGGHREDFGTLIPAWGGKDLWLAAVTEEPGPGGANPPPVWLSFDASTVDFQTFGAARTNPDNHCRG